MSATHAVRLRSGKEAVHTAQRRQADPCCLRGQAAAPRTLAHSCTLLELRPACVLLLSDEVCKQLLRPTRPLDCRDVKIVPVKSHDPPAPREPGDLAADGQTKRRQNSRCYCGDKSCMRALPPIQCTAAFATLCMGSKQSVP